MSDTTNEQTQKDFDEAALVNGDTIAEPQKPEIDYSRWDYGHVMDPETEDLIFGTDLAEGMVVLIEDMFSFSSDSPSRLANEEHYPGEHDRVLKGLDEKNRWCRVTKLNQDPRWESSGDDFYPRQRTQIDPLTRFIGVYDDGTKRTRTYAGTYGWFVKKDSIPVKQPMLDTEDCVHVIDEELWCNRCHNFIL